MEKPGFLSLSDEVLLHIFSFLDGIDKINTYSTCMRFSNVLCDRTLSRKLKLIGNYNVTVEDIKCYLKPKMIRQNIRILDLTNCYWLQPSEVCTAVLNLKNLTAFYSVDVAFTFKQIIKIVAGLPKLKCLSFSWPAASNIEDAPDECLGSLMFLYIYYPKADSVNWSRVVSWIHRCNNLKQLWLIVPRIDFYGDIISLSGGGSSSKLRLDTLVVVGLLGSQNEYFLEQLRDICDVPKQTCKCLWFTTRADAWEEYFQGNEDEEDNLHLNTSWGKCLESVGYKDQRITFAKNGKMKRLYWSFYRPPFSADDEHFENLEELKSNFCFSLALLQPLHMLTVLCIPICCVAGPGGIQKTEMQLLPKWCPQIKHLELHLHKQCFCSKRLQQESKPLLEMIAEWPKLKTLKLTDCWKLRSGKPFDKIFRCCQNLEKLFLSNLGALCGYVFEFTKALKHCKNLKHFRFEDSEVTPVQMRLLFEALTECPLIERVVFVFTKNSKSPADATVLNLIEKLPKLIFLCVVAPSIVEAQKKRLMKTIAKQFMTTRLALCCCFLKYLKTSEDDKVPAIHFFEMLRPDVLSPFEFPYNKEFLFEVPNLDVADVESVF